LLRHDIENASRSDHAVAAALAVRCPRTEEVCAGRDGFVARGMRSSRACAARLSGWSRAVTGENVILVVNLGWSAWLYLRFLGGRGMVAALERWQTVYLPVYAVWAAIVVVVFPPVFGFGWRRPVHRATS
jgi:hypothetical protein